MFDSLHVKHTDLHVHYTCAIRALRAHNTLSYPAKDLRQQGRVLLRSTVSDWLGFIVFYR